MFSLRWRQWQNHLSVLGKVCPILPDAVESSHHYSLHDITDHLVTYSFQRVHEVRDFTNVWLGVLWAASCSGVGSMVELFLMDPALGNAKLAFHFCMSEGTGF